LARTLKSLDEAMYRLERANHMLSLARDQAEEARRLKQQFAQTISHELRTPLNLIVGFTEMMTHSPEHYGGQLLPAYMRDLRIVYRNAAHLQTLVNDVLDLARIEAAQMGLMPEKTRPADLVRDVVTTARSLVEAQGLALRTDIAPDLPAMWLDPTRIRQVLFNLLNNASRFTEAGSITVQVRQVEDEVHFAVADTGVGIAPSDLKRIFEEFQQVDGSTRRRYGGTGLGLAISKRFVTLHGGRMWVESELGAGSTFYFSLPVRQQGIDLATSASASATDQASHPPAAKREENILLVVTPSLPVANLLARRLEGCRTVTAPNLAQARAMAQRLYPKAVVIDQACQLGDDAPASLATFALACQATHTTFVTCPLSHEPARQHLAVEAYLTKPISRQNLWDVLRQLDEGVNKLLIIEDDNDFVQLLDRMLATSVRPYQVVNAYNAQEGLTLMRHHQPDAILLDLQLPDKNGREVIEEIRATPGGEHLPIIVVSGQDEMATDGALHGPVTMTKAEGWTFSEIIQGLQSWITATAPAISNATPAQ
jgi:CheY-like chemotaxis protein/nitrogen-specific signal transduction histidine kinase